MLSGESEQSIFDTIARETAGMTGFPMVAIELCDFERAVMVYRGAHGIPLAEMPSPFEVPMDVSLSGQVAHSGEVLVETNVAECREYAAPILKMLGVQTFVCVPVKAGGRVAGTLSLSHSEPVDVAPRVIKAAVSLANYLATLFDRLQAREAARQSEAELSSVYDRVPSMLCLFDEQTLIVRANRAAVEFTGHDPQSLAGMRPGDFFRCRTNPDPANGWATSPVAPECSLPESPPVHAAHGQVPASVRMTKALLRHGQPAEVVFSFPRSASS